MEINYWPWSQVCVSCDNAVLINDDKFPGSTYGCLMNLEADGHRCKGFIERKEFKCMDDFETEKDLYGDRK